MRKMGIALQLYTLRDETEKDFEGTLRKVADMGYEGVEFAGYGGMDAQRLKRLLDELNLKACGSHVMLDRLRDHLDEELEFNRILGTGYIVCPGVFEADRGEKWKQHFALFSEIIPTIEAAGFRFGYHNHDFEFKESVDGLPVFDALFAAVPAAQVELDVCWVTAAGYDPLAYIAKYAGRLPLLHLKDMRRDGDAVQTVALGQGEIDLPAVIRAASDAGTEWLIVEQDHCQIPPLDSVAQSLQWVRERYLNRL